MSMSYYDAAYELEMQKDMENEEEVEETVEIILIENEERYIMVDSELVKMAEEVCTENLYLLEDAIKRFLCYIVDEGELPFD